MVVPSVEPEALDNKDESNLVFISLNGLKTLAIPFFGRAYLQKFIKPAEYPWFPFAIQLQNI